MLLYTNNTLTKKYSTPILLYTNTVNNRVPDVVTTLRHRNTHMQVSWGRMGPAPGAPYILV